MNVCLIGYNLTNFILALELIKKGFVVDIISEKITKKIKTNRTLGISKNNFKFKFKFKTNIKIQLAFNKNQNI